MRLVRLLMRVARRRLTAWLLLAASLLLLGATVVSSFHAYGIDIEISAKNRWRQFNLAAGDGKYWIHAVPHRSSGWVAPPNRSTLTLWQRPTYAPLFKLLGDPVHPIAGRQAMRSTMGTDHWYYFSGWIPTGLVLCLFAVVYKLSRRKTAGTCGSCGYPRFGLPSSRCPECGQECTNGAS